MSYDDRQFVRLVLLIIGWGTVGVNLAVGFWQGAILLSIPVGWATWIYFKRKRGTG